MIIEDAAESLGASYKGQQTGTFGTYNAISFNGNKIITGSAGGMLLTDDKDAADRARKWSTQSRENAAWYQHEEVGYNYRMSNVIAGVVRGQFPYLKEHIAQKKAIYERYREGFKDLPVQMNPFDAENSEPTTGCRAWSSIRRPCADRCVGSRNPCTSRNRERAVPWRSWRRWRSIMPRGAPSGSPCICSRSTG